MRLIFLSTPGELLNDFILSRIANGAEGLGHCATGLVALESLGRFDQERAVKVVETYVQLILEEKENHTDSMEDFCNILRLLYNINNRAKGMRCLLYWTS